MVILQPQTNGVSFMEDGEEIYFIGNDQLAETRNGNISEWIAHLSEKTWIERDNFYELGKIIYDRNPGSRIDWMMTFHQIERMFYIENVAGHRNESNFLKTLEIGQETNTDEINNEINAIVTKKLEKYQIKA